MTTYKISITVEGHDHASKQLGHVHSALGGLWQVAGGMLAAQIFMGIEMGIINTGKAAINAYANYERLGLSLQSLVAREMVHSRTAKDMASALDMSSGKSKELLDWVEKLAIKSPFTQEGVAAAFQQALVYGFHVDMAKRLTQATIDYAAASGKSVDVMDRISLALGQILAKGKLAGMEVLQLTEAGIPVHQILADAFGKTTAEIVKMQEQGLIPAGEAIDAIITSLEKDFGGAAAWQAGTFSGLISSLQDIKDIGLRTYFEGTFKTLQPYIQSFVDKFSDPKFKANLSAMGERLGTFVGNAIKGFQRLKGIFEDLKNSPIVEAISRNFGKIFAVLTQPQAIEASRRIFEGVKSFLTDLGAKVLPFAVSMFDKIGNWFAKNGPLIGDFMMVIADIINNVVLPVLMTAWNVIAPLLSGVVDLVLGLVKIVMQVVTGDWQGAWDTLVKTLTDAGLAIWEAIVNLLEGIAGLFGTSLEEIGEWWSETWEGFKESVSNIWSAIVGYLSGVWNSITSAFINFVNGVRERLAAIGNAIMTGWNVVTSIVRTGTLVILGLIFMFWDWILGFFGTSILEIKAKVADWWNGMLATVQQASMVILTTIMNFVAGIVNGVRTAWHNVSNAVKEIVTVIGGIVQTLWSGMVTTVGQKLTEMQSKVKSFAAPISNAVKDIWDKASQKAREFIDKFVNVGKDIIGGLVRGIKAAKAAVVTALQDIINEAIEKAMAVLGISSPSKLFTWFGEMMMQGLAAGINKFTNVPQLALDRALSGVTGGQATSLSSYVNNSRDFSQNQKYYAPVTYEIKTGEQGINKFLRETRIT